MIDDIIFHSNYFFLELPTYSSGTIARIEAQSEYFEIRIPNKEAVSIF
jgi:hypothetical protein